MNFRRDQSSDMLADDNTKDRTIISDRAVGSSREENGQGERVDEGIEGHVVREFSGGPRTPSWSPGWLRGSGWQHGAHGCEG